MLLNPSVLVVSRPSISWPVYDPFLLVYHSFFLPLLDWLPVIQVVEVKWQNVGVIVVAVRIEIALVHCPSSQLPSLLFSRTSPVPICRGKTNEKDAVSFNTSVDGDLSIILFFQVFGDVLLFFNHRPKLIDLESATGNILQHLIV